MELRRFLDRRREDGDPKTYRRGDQSGDDERHEPVHDRLNGPATARRTDVGMTVVSLSVSYNLRSILLENLLLGVQDRSLLLRFKRLLDKLRLIDLAPVRRTLIRSDVVRGAYNDLLLLFLSPGARRGLDAFRSPAFFFSLFHGGESLLQSGKSFLQSNDRPLAAQRLIVTRRRLGGGEPSRIALRSSTTIFFSTTLFLPLFECGESPVAEKGLAHLSLQSLGVRQIKHLAGHCQHRKIP